jgi:hypothetical protein
MTTLTGVDVAGDVRPYLPQFKAAGISFVFRYYALQADTRIPGKIIGADEARAISAAGFKLGAVFENGQPTTAEYFTSDRGRTDAAIALQCAARIAQPATTPIFFTVDCDLPYEHISTSVFNYFVGIRNALIAANLGYQVGVYGSGLLCEKMTDWALAMYSWLAGAKGWAGYAEFLPRATIVQGSLPAGLHGLPDFPYSDSDGDTTSAVDYGGFQVPVDVSAV